MKIDVSLGAIQELLKIYEERIQVLTSQVNPLKEENEKLVEDIKSLKEDNFKFIKQKEQNEELKRKYEEMRKENIKIKQQLEQMYSDSGVKNKEILELKSEIDDLNAKYRIAATINRELVNKDKTQYKKVGYELKGFKIGQKVKFNDIAAETVGEIVGFSNGKELFILVESDIGNELEVEITGVNEILKKDIDSKDKKYRWVTPEMITEIRG